MSESKKVGQKLATGKTEVHSADFPASPGDASRGMASKDSSPQDASREDLSGHRIASADSGEHEEALLDEAVEETFPASDPVAERSPSHGDRHAAAGSDAEEDSLDDAIEMTFPASDPIAIPSSEELHHERDLRQGAPSRPPVPPH